MKMKKAHLHLPWLRPGLLVLAAGVFVAPAFAGDADAIARIGSAEIKANDVKPYLENLSAQEKAALARDPAALTQVVRTLIIQQLVLKEAQAAKWDQQPKVEERLERLRQNAIAEGYLQSVSKAPEGYPSEAELKAAYEENKAALLVPRQFLLAQVYVAVPKGADKAAADKAQARLESVRAALKQADADFAAIAKAQSDEPQSAAKGGEIGWLTEAQIQPEVRARVGTLAKNSVAEPVLLADGWHIVKVVDVKEAYTPSLDEVRAGLTQRLRAVRAQANSEAYLAKLLQQNPVAINEIALSQLVGPKSGD